MEYVKYDNEQKKTLAGKSEKIHRGTRARKKELADKIGWAYNTVVS